jgi:hypothetical protein
MHVTRVLTNHSGLKHGTNGAKPGRCRHRDDYLQGKTGTVQAWERLPNGQNLDGAGVGMTTNRAKPGWCGYQDDYPQGKTWMVRQYGHQDDYPQSKTWIVRESG